MINSDDILSVQCVLEDVYRLEAAKEEHKASKVIFRFIEENFANSRLDRVNQLLVDVDLDRLSALSMSGMVRFTACAKAHLPAWKMCLDKVFAELSNREMNASAILVGLIK